MAAAAGSGGLRLVPRPGPARFRGCLAGALLGDCLGAVFEGRSVVKLPDLLRFLRGLEPAPGPKRFQYTDDTAMSRSVVQSLLAKREFDEVDMAKRFAEEYKKEPNRGYGMAVVNVFKKLLSPKCNDVFEPARAQVAGISLAYSDVQDVKKFCSLCVFFCSLQKLSKETFLEQLISHMEDIEADDKSLTDARVLVWERRPECSAALKIIVLVVFFLTGNGIAALRSVPTAIYSFLRCMEADPDIPEHYSNLQRTIIYCISLGGDTDTIATMAGAIAGAYYGEEQIPPSWEQSCEAFQETQKLANSLYELYCQRL
uniref:ADP-ribosylhydrolase ARH3 n=1 Tax=Anas platyrhynchos TaxID=8839 RepID=A0A8B9T2Z5_ANAPL